MEVIYPSYGCTSSWFFFFFFVVASLNVLLRFCYFYLISVILERLIIYFSKANIAAQWQCLSTIHLFIGNTYYSSIYSVVFITFSNIFINNIITVIMMGYYYYYHYYYRIFLFSAMSTSYASKILLLLPRP